MNNWIKCFHPFTMAYHLLSHIHLSSWVLKTNLYLSLFSFLLLYIQLESENDFWCIDSNTNIVLCLIMNTNIQVNGSCECLFSCSVVPAFGFPTNHMKIRENNSGTRTLVCCLPSLNTFVYLSNCITANESEY